MAKSKLSKPLNGNLQGPDGKFKKGHTQGGRKGRSIARTKILNSFERLGYTEEQFIDEVVYDAVMLADPEATKFVLEKLLPKAKPVQDPIEFEITGTTLMEKADSLLKGIAQGEISIDQAALLMNSLGTLTNIVELEAIQQRLAALEAQPKAIEGEVDRSGEDPFDFVDDQSEMDSDACDGEE